MWSIIKWLVWGDPMEDIKKEKLLVLRKKIAARKIVKAYLFYKKNVEKKQIVKDNLNDAKTSFVNTADQSTSTSPQKKKIKKRKKRKKKKKMFFSQQINRF